MNPIVVKALAVCAAHVVTITSSYPSCFTIGVDTNWHYVMTTYEPGYERCTDIVIAANREEQREKDEASKKRAKADEPTLAAAAKALGVEAKPESFTETITLPNCWFVDPNKSGACAK